MNNTFYCHYDEQTLEILQVGSNKICETKRDNVKHFEIPFDPIAKSILSGETYPEDWIVTIINSYETLVKTDRKRFSITNNTPSRIKFLNLKEIGNSGKSSREITIYITKRKDPSVFVNSELTKKWNISKEFSVFTDKSNLD